MLEIASTLWSYLISYEQRRTANSIIVCGRFRAIVWLDLESEIVMRYR